jgi:hypothetical protein
VIVGRKFASSRPVSRFNATIWDWVLLVVLPGALLRTLEKEPT